MLDWMRDLKLRWLVAIVVGWWATVLVVLLAFTLLSSVYDAKTVEGGLNMVFVYPSSVTEQLGAAALAVPLPFAFLWLLLRLLPRRK